MANNTQSTSIFDQAATTATETFNSINSTFNSNTGTFTLGSNGGNIFSINIPQVQEFNTLLKDLSNIPDNPWIPKTPPNQQQPQNQQGSPTTPALARGAAINVSSIGAANANLFHGCGFINDITGPLISSITSSISSIKSIISLIKKPRKYGAGAAIRIIFGQLGKLIRQAINFIIKTLNLQPVPSLTAAFNEAKKVLRYIAKWLKWAKRIARDIAAFYTLATNLQQLMNYIKSLPARVLAIIRNCLNQFLGGITQLTNLIKTLPGVVNNNNTTTIQILQNVTDSANSTANVANSSSNAANTNTLLANNNSFIATLINSTINVSSSVINSGNVGISNTHIQDYVSSTYGNTQTTQANTNFSTPTYSANNNTQP
jgi:large-conductance mechanosensitive channel